MERRIINPWTWQDNFGYVQANEVSGAQRTLFLAGQASVDEEGRPVHPDDMGAQLTQAMDNLETVLREAGAELSEVVRLNFYTTDVDRFFEVSGVAIGRLEEAGCRPASRARSQDMLDRDYFSHYTPQGTTVMDELERLGYFGPEAYHLVGENIARGGNGTDTDTPEYMFDGLMHSPGHRENILEEGYTEAGIGARSGTYQHYDDTSTIYTVVFGGYD